MRRFAIVFFVLVLVLFALGLTPPGQQVVKPWTELVASAGAGLIRALGGEALAQGIAIVSPGTGLAVRIEAGTSAIEALMVLCAAIVAFPAPWKSRAAGFALGAVAIQALNLLLIVAFFQLGQWNKAWFEWAQLYLWQTLIMLAALAAWLLWIRREPREAVFKAMVLALLALPLCLALWYFAAPLLDDLAGRAAKPAISAGTQGRVADSAFKHRAIQYTVAVMPPYVPGRSGARELLADIEVNASPYTVGFALFLALSLAAKPSRRGTPLFIGCGALAVLPAWGVAFDALRQLGSSPQLTHVLLWVPWQREAVALGYQVGALLLPTLAPVVLWLGLNSYGTPKPDSSTPAGQSASIA